MGFFNDKQVEAFETVGIFVANAGQLWSLKTNGKMCSFVQNAVIR